MGAMINGLDSEVLLNPNVEWEKTKRVLKLFIDSGHGLGGLVCFLHFCEHLNLANVIFQVIKSRPIYN